MIGTFELLFMNLDRGIQTSNLGFTVHIHISFSVGIRNSYTIKYLKDFSFQKGPHNTSTNFQLIVTNSKGEGNAPPQHETLTVPNHHNSTVKDI